MNRTSSLIQACLLGLGLAAASVLVFAQTTYRWVDKEGRTHYSDQPPPSDAKKVEERRIGSGNFVETSGPSYSLRKAQQDFPVSLFTSVDCEPECKPARDFLAGRGIPFSEVVLKTQDDAIAFKRQFNAEVFVPSITVGSQKFKGFEQGAWTRLLDEAGYPKTAIPGQRTLATLPAARASAPATPAAETPTPAVPAQPAAQ